MLYDERILVVAFQGAISVERKKPVAEHGDDKWDIDFLGVVLKVLKRLEKLGAGDVLVGKRIQVEYVVERGQLRLQVTQQLRNEVCGAGIKTAQV